jgi:cytoskeletal protein CcmA (bactofilin family)
MSVKLGNTEASLYLGSTPVGAYLGAVQVYSAAATLYFNGAVDGDWAEIGNWWLDDEHTQAAGRLPTSADSVVATASITASGQTVVDFTLNDPDNDALTLSGTLTVTGNATFNNTARIDGGTVTGNATFNGSTSIVNGGTVTGNATFTDGGAYNDGTVGGNATFNDGVNYGTVSGTATFTGSACNDGGTAGTFVPNPPPSC